MDRIEQTIMKKAETDSQYAIAYALLRISHQLQDIGLGTMGSPGALEFIGMQMRDNNVALVSVIENLGNGLTCTQHD